MIFSFRRQRENTGENKDTQKREKQWIQKENEKKTWTLEKLREHCGFFHFFDFVFIISSFLDHFFHFLGSIFSPLFLKEELVEKRMGNRGKRNKDTRKFREPLRFSVFLHLPCFSIFYSFFFLEFYHLLCGHRFAWFLLYCSFFLLADCFFRW